MAEKLRYGGEISHDGVQCFAWDFALVCLFRPPFLEVEIKNQQDWRIAHAEMGYALIADLKTYTKKYMEKNLVSSTSKAN